MIKQNKKTFNLKDYIIYSYTIFSLYHLFIITYLMLTNIYPKMDNY